jgi:hypothetical protein
LQCTFDNAYINLIAASITDLNPFDAGTISYCPTDEYLQVLQ